MTKSPVRHKLYRVLLTFFFGRERSPRTDILMFYRGTRRMDACVSALDAPCRGARSYARACPSVVGAHRGVCAPRLKRDCTKQLWV